MRLARRILYTLRARRIKDWRATGAFAGAEGGTGACRGAEAPRIQSGRFCQLVTVPLVAGWNRTLQDVHTMAQRAKIPGVPPSGGWVDA
jgi:hypothetical protein